MVSQDGPVANLAKIPVRTTGHRHQPRPGPNPRILEPHPPDLLTTAGSNQISTRIEPLTMVQATTDDGQSLTALNEISVGIQATSRQRYTGRLPDGRSERRSSSGLTSPERDRPDRTVQVPLAGTAKPGQAHCEE